MLSLPKLEISIWSYCLLVASFHDVLAYNILYSEETPVSITELDHKLIINAIVSIIKQYLVLVFN